MTKAIKIFLVTFLSVSCGLLVTSKKDFVIWNKSSYNLVISAFSENRLIDIIFIEAGEKFVKTLEERADSGVISVFDMYKVDSIAVVFDNKKFLYQGCNGVLLFGAHMVNPTCTWEKNLIDFATGEQRSAFLKNREEIIVFDDTDYAKAQEIP